jgi:type II secretory pathway pseudopilin PulG
MRRRREQGATGALIAVILVLVMVGLFATSVLRRVAASGDEASETLRRLAAGADALEQFAAINARLPCPANPATNDGGEVITGGNIAKCDFPEGTIPWRTLGMKFDDALDSWGRKVSYRVYTGTNSVGSLTQPGGISMVECDTLETVNGDATSVSGALGGLCYPITDPDPLRRRSTLPANFLAGKGLSLDDFGTSHSDVAYVLISHGATGLGGYTVSGIRLDLPSGAERNNTQDTGAFTIRAFSDPDVAADNSAHFDDLLFYRTLPDLVKRTNLSARDWPET